MSFEAVLNIINSPTQTIEQKLQSLADEALEKAQRFHDDPRLQELPVWYEAVVLFEFSLGFLCISYPGLSEIRATILEVFKKEVIRFNLPRHKAEKVL